MNKAHASTMLVFLLIGCTSLTSMTPKVKEQTHQSEIASKIYGDSPKKVSESAKLAKTTDGEKQPTSNPDVDFTGRSSLPSAEALTSLKPSNESNMVIPEQKNNKNNDSQSHTETMSASQTRPSETEPTGRMLSESAETQFQITKQLVLPKSASPVVTAPDVYQHPLKESTNLIFMLGEDSEGFYLYGEGSIIPGAYEKFIKYVGYYRTQGKQLDRLMLHSPGGVVHEGIKIGVYLRENGWVTDSDQHMKCYSTCGFIYAAGVKKRFQPGAEIGFHRPFLSYKKDTEESKTQMHKVYLPYWKHIEANQSLYDDFMQNYARDEMLILDVANISEYFVVERY